jgi:hypothetical protein
VNDIGSLGEAARFDDGDESAQLVDVDERAHGLASVCGGRYIIVGD